MKKKIRTFIERLERLDNIHQDFAKGKKLTSNPAYKILKKECFDL